MIAIMAEKRIVLEGIGEVVEVAGPHTKARVVLNS